MSTPRTLSDAVIYFVQAREFDAAGQSLAFGLVSYSFEKRDVSPGNILLLYWEGPLPPEMSADVAVSLRCARIAAGVRAGKNIDALVEDLTTRLADASLAWGPAAGATVAFQPLMKMNVAAALTLLRAGMRGFAVARLPNGTLLSESAPVRLELLLWLVTSDLRSANAIAQWIGLLLELSPESLAVRSDWVSFREASLIVIDGLWQREAEKPVEERNWPLVDEQLTSIRTKARAGGNSHVLAAATRARMVVLAEYEDRATRCHRPGPRGAAARRRGSARNVLHPRVRRPPSSLSWRCRLGSRCSRRGADCAEEG